MTQVAGDAGMAAQQAPARDHDATHAVAQSQHHHVFAALGGPQTISPASATRDQVVAAVLQSANL
jgi:hypothetical protein